MANATASASAARYTRGTLIGAIVVAALWHGANDAVVLIRGWADLRPPMGAGLSLAAWVAYTVIGVIAASVLLRGRDVGRVAVLIGLPVLLAGAAAGVVASGPGQVFGPANWPWGSVGWFALLLLWRRPLSWLVAVLGANALIVLVTMRLIQDIDRIDVARWAMTVYGVSVLQVVFAAGAGFLERDATRAAQAARLRARAAAARAAAQRVHEDRIDRYRAVESAASDLLVGLAAGRLDPSTPTTQRRCAAQAARLRRLLAERDDSPEPLVHELRACAEVAECRGVTVELEVLGSVPAIPLAVRRALTEPPIDVLTAARTRARITVAADPSVIVVGVVADTVSGVDGPGTTSFAGPVTVAVSHHREGELLWVQTQWHLPSPSPSSTTIPSSRRASSRG
ncbi:MAG TPA: hypothetical protein VGJ63_12480 [Micromonosporaceae bacterium]|jgi:hypothetical protein